MTPEDEVGIIYTLITQRNHYPELSLAERKAVLRLAVAIVEMDRVEEGEGLSLREQYEVEVAKNEYAQALANLVRGEVPDGS